MRLIIQPDIESVGEWVAAYVVKVFDDTSYVRYDQLCGTFIDLSFV